MNNEFKVGDLVTMNERRAALMVGPPTGVGFITEFGESASGRLAKVMWVNGEHYFCHPNILKLRIAFEVADCV